MTSSYSRMIFLLWMLSARNTWISLLISSNYVARCSNSSSYTVRQSCIFCLTSSSLVCLAFAFACCKSIFYVFLSASKVALSLSTSRCFDFRAASSTLVTTCGLVLSKNLFAASTSSFVAGAAYAGCLPSGSSILIRPVSERRLSTYGPLPSAGIWRTMADWAFFNPGDIGLTAEKPMSPFGTIRRLRIFFLRKSPKIGSSSNIEKSTSRRVITVFLVI